MAPIPIPLILKVEGWTLQVNVTDEYVQLAMIEDIRSRITHYMQLSHAQAETLSDYLQLV